MARKLTVEEFWQRVQRRGPDECWPWLARLTPKGYGVVAPGLTGTTMAHRAAYIITHGSVQQDMVVDHTCHGLDCHRGNSCEHRRCCNPAHLEEVTAEENVMRGTNYCANNARVTHCPQGHPYDGYNLVFDSAHRRRCRICKVAKLRKWRAKRRAAHLAD